MRAAADAPAVQELVAPAREAEVEDLGVLDEERPPLLEEGLEGGQVDHRGVRLDLPEVRVDGGVEREGGAEAEPEVGAHARAGRPPVEERILGVGGTLVVAAQHVRAGLDAPDRAGHAHVGEGAELADEPADPAALHREVAQLPRHDPTPVEVHAPRLRPGSRLVADLRERDADLDVPPRGVDGDRRLPDGVPVGVLTGVVEHVQVLLHAGGVDAEGVAAPAVVVGVERHTEPVEERTPLVTPQQQPPDVVGIALEQAGGDPDGVRVEEHPHLGLLPRRSALERLARDEVGNERRVLPGRLLDQAVDPDVAPAHPGLGDRRRPHRPVAGRRALGALGGEGSRGDERDEHDPARRAEPFRPIR